MPCFFNNIADSRLTYIEKNPYVILLDLFVRYFNLNEFIINFPSFRRVVRFHEYV